MGGEISQGFNHNKICSMPPNLGAFDSEYSRKTVMTESSTPPDFKKATKSMSSSKYSVGKSKDTKQKRKKVKKEKLLIVAKNVEDTERKSLELIHNNNKEKEDYDLIYSLIDKHFFLQTLNDQARNEIIITMSLCKVKANTTLFEQGTVGFYWYIVHKGQLEFYSDGKLIKTYTRGDSFGERALLYNALRTGTCKTVSECELWVLKREVFRKILDFIFTMKYEENMKFLVDLPLDSTFKSILANNLIQQIYEKDMYICKENELGTCMFIIKDGEVNIKKNDKIIRTLQKGDYFGQKALLLEHNRRTMDVVAKTKCVLLTIGAEFLKTQLGDHFKEKLYISFLRMSFHNSNYFKTINLQMLLKTFPYFSFKNYQKDEVVFEKGKNMKNVLCAILEGSIANKNINLTVAKRYEFIFEKNLFEEKDNILQNDLVADPDCLIAIADYAEFKRRLGGDIQTIEKKSLQLDNISHITLFKNLSEDKIERLASKLNIEHFHNGQKIIEQGEKGSKFYIIKSGRVDIFINSKYVRSLNDGEEFGAKSLLVSDKRSATAIANGPVSCYTITSAVFKSILEPNLIKAFEKKIALEDNTIELKDLENIKELGHGNFGFVNLVKCRKNKQLYAIKALSSVQIKKEKLQACVKMEKDVLLKVDHPFIMKMVKYLKSENFIFFLMEYVRGRELWEVIREIGLLSRDQTQFYGASMLLAIDYLHKKNIIYRDIKPENIMVNDMGYIKIIDFGTVKEIKDRTNTVIGTSHYMAPEILKGAGYSFQVDVWSIAVCMYEFYCGKLPFGDEYNEPLEIYKAVAKDDLFFPPFVHDDKFIDILRRMLKKSPTSRLWKLQQIKEQPYFREFDWDKLINLEFNPPYRLKNLENINENNEKLTPYLACLKNHKVERRNRVNPSIRELEFDKWLKNF